MFITKQKVYAMAAEAIENLTPEDIGLVQCEHTKLYGKIYDMIKKTVRYTECGMFTQFEREKEIYFSPAFAPEWDIKDTTVTPPKYYKINEREEVEIIKSNVVVEDNTSLKNIELVITPSLKRGRPALTAQQRYARKWYRKNKARLARLAR